MKIGERSRRVEVWWRSAKSDGGALVNGGGGG